MTKNLHTNRRHHRLLGLLYGTAIALIIFVSIAVHARASGDQGNFMLGLILSIFFLLVVGGLEYFAQRYVYALDQVLGGVVVITKGISGRKYIGKIYSIGAEIRQQGAQYDNLHHKVTAGSPRKTYILDVTNDPDLVSKLRRLLQ